ncbi:unnamed protein product [Rotaria sp. Silwood2]|nr:unnamed protein product [Rotaria sp. Silwood2]
MLQLPFDVHRHCLLVTYPVITIDSRVHTGLQVLVKEYQCKQSNMISITSFSTPDEIKHICELYPGITIICFQKLIHPKFVTKEEREAVVLRRQQVEVEQTATKDDRTDRPSTSNNS